MSPVKDIRSDFDLTLTLNSAISSDTTTSGAIIDTQDYDLGVTFYFQCSAYSDGTYTPVIQEGDAANLSDATSVADGNMIPQSGGEAAAALSAATSASSGELTSIGVIGTKRYIRAQIVSTSTSSGATIQVLALKKKEVLKAT